ncbi:hypothetical protein VTI28DRAFT_595 [Corynascus sepedonium]
MADGTPVQGSVWFYAPAKVGPILFTVLFGLSGAFHLWQCFHYKWFRVTAYLPFCCILFTAGFALRIVGANDYGNSNIYIASTILIYMAPPILELANYHILGRALYYVPYFSPIHPGRVLTTLGTLSAVVEALNGSGIAYLATSRTNGNNNERRYALGLNLLRASLALQLAVILFFYALATVFHTRCARAGLDRRIRTVLVSLYVSMLLILARTVYRGVEHFAVADAATPAGVTTAGHGSSPGGSGEESWRGLSPIVRYEWFFWVFEAIPMLANVLLWNSLHPRHRCGGNLPRDHRHYLAQDGETELDGPGWADRRNVVMTFIDPFGLFAMCEKERKGELFWEENGYHHLLAGKRENGQDV